MRLVLALQQLRRAAGRRHVLRLVLRLLRPHKSLSILAPPAPLDDYAILENIKGFLVEKDYVAMRAVSKALRGTIDTHCQMKKIRVNLQQAYELPSLDFVTELTITAQKHYENERPRDGHLARIQRAPMLEKVIFEGADPTHYMDTLARVPTIKIIIVRDFSGDYGNSSDYVRHLVRALPSWPGLVKLKLYKGSQHDHMQALINFLPNLQKLKSLDLNLHSDHALDLAPLSRCVALQSLSLTRAREPVLATVSQLKINKLHIHSGYLPVRRVDANPVLKNLYITHPVGSMKTIRAFVQAFPELVGLNISGASDAAYYEGDEDGVWRWPWLGLKKLKMLTAGSMEIKNHEFTSFCEQLPDGLEQLFVHGLQTTRFQPLIEQLGRLKLWSLGLNGNHCESVLHLARCLTEFAPGLQQLGFTLQNMTYDDARAAIAQFREFAGLRQVYLYKSGFRSTKLHPADFAGLRALLADRPTVLVSDPAIGTHIKKKF